ncbi:MAG: 3-oxoacyl-[acyl-carrier protein] reductase [Pseudohongiellaceae bacterium]|jgi:3-oxoacyl-[acyl-carrier protein] reductase
MNSGLKDKVVLMTGASGGIGRALARGFGAEGSQLVLSGHSQLQKLQSWTAEQPFADRALVVGADVSQASDVEQLFAAAKERFGRVDVCLANAGVWPTEDCPLATMTPERLARTVSVNLLGSAHTARSFLATLQDTGPRSDGHGAALIFTGSTAGRFGERDHSDYAMAKAGLNGLLMTLKNEIVSLDPFGRVNMIEPGWTVTHMARPALAVPGTITKVVSTMPLRQLGRAKDIASTALWLASPLLARHVTGQIVTVAGGMEGRVLWSPDDISEAAVRQRLEED